MEYRQAPASPANTQARLAELEERLHQLETERRLWHQTEHFYRAALALHQTIWIDEVLDAILAQVGAIVQHDAVSIMLVQNGQAMVARWQRRQPETPGHSMLGFTLPVATTPSLQQMHTTGRPLLWANVEREPGWQHWPETAWIKSYLGLPLLVSGQPAAYLHLNSATPGAFTAIDAARLQAFGRQAEVALKNAGYLHKSHQETGQRLKALIKERQFTATLLEATEAMTIILNPQGQIVNTNQTTRRVLGYTFEEMRQRHISKVLPNAARHGQLDQLLRHPHTVTTPRVFECPCHAKDGQIHHIRWTVSPTLDADEQLAYLVITGINISAQYHAEAALRRSDEIFGHVVNQSGDGISLVDQTGRVTLWNEACARIAGIPAHEAVGQPIWELLHRLAPLDKKTPALYEHFRSSALLMVQQQGFWQVQPPRDIEIERPDGERRMLQTVLFPVNTGAEFLVGGLVRDVTARTEAEQQMHLLATAIDSISEGIIITDARLGLPGPEIVFANQGICQMTGYTKPELLGQTPRIFQGPQTNQATLARLKATLKQGNSFTGEAVNHRKDGSVYRADWHIAPVFNADGNISHYISIQRDVTEMRQMEAQMRQTQRMEAIGRLAGGVAHDFNNLLTVIKGYTQFLLDSLNQTDPLAEDVAQIDRVADRATALTRQLLLFSRRQMVRPQRLDLNDIIRNMDKMLHRLMGEDIYLALGLAPDLPWVSADPGQLEQVVMNLAVNARDAMPTGGQLTIETSAVTLAPGETTRLANLAPGQYVRLTVSDTGTGISDEVQSHIFEPFFTTKAEGHGTGLGLATVYAIVTQYGGGIYLESHIGHGSTFFLYLPVSEQGDATLQTVGARAKADSKSAAETILLVEDESTIRQLAERVLTRQGYTVLPASDANQALLIVEQYRERIDLLLTDVVMPGGLSGRDLAQRLQQKLPNLKVIYMSGYVDDILDNYDVNNSQVAFIAKPFTPAELETQVRAVLDTG